VRICVEGYGYCRVSKHFGDDLRVHVAGEQQRGTRVPEVVETDLREPRPLRERLERATGEVVAVEGLTRLGGEYEAVLAPQRPYPSLLVGAPGGH
jgi:hypothetical protein